MSSSELSEHAGYFRDRHKLRAYERALHDVVRPGDVVVDLGAGTGLLGLLAARAGAGRIYMVDSGSILGAARDLASANGYADRVVTVRGRSTDVTLPERADVVVCDQIGGFVHDAGVLDYFADARERLLKPGGALIPAAFTLYVAPVTAPGPRQEVDVWGGSPAGFDTTSVHRLATNSEWRVEASSATLAAPPMEVGRLHSWSLGPVVRRGTFELDASARIDGLLGWFDAELAPGVHLTNAPGATDRMRRWCTFYPVPAPLDALAGDRLSVTVDLRPGPGLVTWAVIWSRGEEILSRGRCSTFVGQFLDDDDLVLASNRPPPRTTAAGSAVASALCRADGRTDVDSIVDEVLREHPDAFASTARGRSVLGEQLAAWASATS